MTPHSRNQQLQSQGSRGGAGGGGGSSAMEVKIVEDRLEALKKQHKDEKAQLLKKQAVLEQQVTQLKIQLQESEHREKEQKRVSEWINSNLQQQLSQAQQKQSQPVDLMQRDIDENHPKVKDILQLHQTKSQLVLMQEKEKFSQKQREDELLIQDLKYKIKDFQREITQLTTLLKQNEKSAEQFLQSKQLHMSQELEQMKDKGDQKFRLLEQEMDKLQSAERNERLTMLNKHIEHVNSLNEQIKKQQKDNTDLQQQLKQSKVINEQLSESTIDLQSNIEFAQERILELEQTIQELDQSSTQSIVDLQEELRMARDENMKQMSQISQLTERLNKQEMLKDKQTSLKQKVQAKRQDYFSVINTTASKEVNKSNNHSFSSKRSNSNTSLRQKSIDQSYTRILDETSTLIQQQHDEDKLNKLNRQVAQYRSKATDFEISLKELQLKYKKDTDSLKSQLKLETKRREDIQFQNKDRQDQLLAEIVMKDKQIQDLTRELRRFSSESIIESQQAEATVYNALTTNRSKNNNKSRQILSSRESSLKKLHQKSSSAVQKHQQQTERVVVQKQTKKQFQDSPMYLSEVDEQQDQEQLLESQNLKKSGQLKSSSGGIFDQELVKTIEKVNVSRNLPVQGASDNQINYETTQQVLQTQDEDAETPEKIVLQQSQEIIDIQLEPQTKQKERLQTYNPKTMDALQNSLMKLASNTKVLLSGNSSIGNDSLEFDEQKQNTSIESPKAQIQTAQQNQRKIGSPLGVMYNEMGGTPQAQANSQKRSSNKQQQKQTTKQVSVNIGSLKNTKSQSNLKKPGAMSVQQLPLQQPINKKALNTNVGKEYMSTTPTTATAQNVRSQTTLAQHSNHSAQSSFVSNAYSTTTTSQQQKHQRRLSKGL